jgi:hypothetical protein
MVTILFAPEIPASVANKKNLIFIYSVGRCPDYFKILVFLT